MLILKEKVNFVGLLIYISILLSSNAFAKTGGNEVGNGGNAIVCGDKEIFYRFYDEYEAFLRYVLPLKLPVSNGNAIETENELVLRFIERLNLLDPQLAFELKTSAINFHKESNFLYGVKLSSVDDSGFWFVPKNCKLKQVIIQKKPVFKNDLRYWIDGDLWNQMPMESKAIAVLHEIVYKKAISIDANIATSEGIRYFVGLLISDGINSLSFQDYENIKIQVGLLSN